MYAEILQTLVVGALVAVVVYVVFVVLRNVRAHRFFKIHSPNLPVAPNAGWFGGHAIEVFYGGRNWMNIDRRHKELGKNVGGYLCDRPTISTTDLEFIKRIVIDEPDKHPNRFHLNCLSDEIEVDCIFMAQNDQWRRLRKCIAPAFSSHRIKSANVQAEIKSVIDKFVASIERRLDKQTGSNGAVEVDADDLFQRFSLAQVFHSFYKQTDLIDFDAEVDRNVVEVGNILQAFANPLLTLSSIFPILRPILLWLANNVHPQARLRAKIIKFINCQAKLNQQARRTIDEAKLAGEKMDEDTMVLAGGEKFRRNMIDYIIDQVYMGKMTPREYVHSTFNLFFAANKTTSDALAKTFYLLASHQSVQDKLRKVVESEGSRGEYLNWVLFEAMRLYPPALIGCTRTISSDERTSDGHLIPKGTLVHTPPHTIHRLEEYWGNDAHQFRPERWENSKSFHPCQFLSFGAGIRSCLGKELAMHEMRSLTVELISKYKFDKSPKSDGFLAYSAPLLITIAPDEPTYVIISRLKRCR